MRLTAFNYAQLDETEATASTSNVNFPVANIKHQHRSKQWRSNAAGNFIISTKNKIDFTEDGSTQLTATVTAGKYSATTLALAIAASMEAVGAESYNVTFSQTTGLWTIASEGETFTLLNSSGTNAANSLLTNTLGFSLGDLTEETEYTGPNIAIHTSEFITFDLRTIEEIDSIVLLWPKEEGIRLSESAVVKIQANALNTWGNPAFESTITLNRDFQLAEMFLEEPETYRYWRVEIIDPKNAYLYVNLGVVMLGQHENVENPSNGFVYTLVDQSMVRRNDYGHEFVDEYPLRAELSINFDLLDVEAVEALEKVFRYCGNRKPVYISLDHDESVFSAGHFSIYGKLPASHTANHIIYNLFNTSTVISEIS